MRRVIVALLVTVAAAAPVAAQFEGTIAMKVSRSSGEPETDVKVVMKNGMQATYLTAPAASGPMAGAEMRLIFDGNARTLTTVMALPPGMSQMPALANAKGIKSVVSLDAARGMRGDAADDKVDVKKLGTTERIAGIDCDDYELTSSKGTARACIAHSLGTFMFPQTTSPMGRGRATNAPTWAKAFGDTPSFPLKVWEPNGDVALEVTSVQKGAVPASSFDIPADYVDMSALFRGRGGL